ncbi:MAG: ABC transporter permease [Candidatus Atribacteria bacterium]|jgi:simple sugar transport system permease protein|nr:ABC transporter permease [Candidatus Atribacteria bacterium]
MVTDRLNKLKRILLLREISSFVMVIVVILIFFTLAPLFLSRENIGVILEIVPELGIVALGVTMLLVTGEIDLSMGSVFCFCPIILATLIERGITFPLSFLFSLILGIGIGFINGFVTVTFAIPSFITTLGTMLVWRGGVLLLTGGWPPFFPTEIPTWFLVGSIGILRMSLFWYAGITVLLWFILERSDFGNWMFATGGNPVAARAMGVDTKRVKIANFMICSFLAGFAGIIQSFRLQATLPSMGTGLEMDAIAASVIGGTSMTGGMGTIIGTTIGSFVIRFIDNGLVMARAPSYWFRVFIGIVTIFAVIFNTYLRERTKRFRC